MTRRAFFTAVLFLHTLVLVVLLYVRTRHTGWDYTVMLLGNGVLAAVTLVGYVLGTQPGGDRPAAFVRGVFSGTLLKLFVLAGGVLVYVLMVGERLHKPSLAVVGGLYILYTALETAALQRHARTPGR